MTDITLHHCEMSPYSEKVRLGLGLKGLPSNSVEIPVIMPKPEGTPAELTAHPEVREKYLMV